MTGELEVLPPFELPEAEGGTVRTWDYRGHRNLIVLFAHAGCPGCEDAVKELNSAYESIAAEQAELLLILPAPIAEAASFKHRLKLRFPVLSDSDLEAHRRYGAVAGDGKPTIALLITDRFGGIYYRALFDEAENLPPPSEVINWLNFIERQCPECGAPEWDSR